MMIQSLLTPESVAALCPWAEQTLLASTGLIALALIARRPLAQLCGPRLAYAIWALPLARLLLPPLVLPAWMAPASPVVADGAAPGTVDVVASPATGFTATAGVSSAPVAPVIDWNALLLSIWLVGAIVFVVWRIVAYRRMRFRLLDTARPMGEAFLPATALTRVRRVRIVETPETTGPLAFGLADRVVALPIGFMARPDRRGRDLAIAHELAHHAGHDLAANFAAQLVLALHWFNPIAWLGWQAMRRDQEAACDARVLAGRDAGTRAAYGTLVASFATGGRLALAAPIAGPAVIRGTLGALLGEKSVVHRLRCMTRPEPSTARRRLGLGLLAASALALPITASISYAADDAPPAPATPPVPEVRHGRHIVIVEKDAHADPAKLRSRTLTRGDTTITVTADHEVTDADLEAHLADAQAKAAEARAKGAEAQVKGVEARAKAEEARAKAAEARALAVLPPLPPSAPGAAPLPPMAPMPPMPPKLTSRADRVIVQSDDEDDDGDTPGRHVSRRIVMRDAADADDTDVEDAAPSGDCPKEAHPINVRTSQVIAGKKQVTRIRICTRAPDPAVILSAIRSARNSIATDPNIPAQARSEALREIDAQIAELAKKS